MPSIGTPAIASEEEGSEPSPRGVFSQLSCQAVVAPRADSGTTGPGNGHRTFSGFLAGRCEVTSAMASAPVFLLLTLHRCRLRFRRRFTALGMVTVLPPLVAVKR